MFTLVFDRVRKPARLGHGVTLEQSTVPGANATLPSREDDSCGREHAPRSAFRVGRQGVPRAVPGTNIEPYATTFPIAVGSGNVCCRPLARVPSAAFQQDAAWQAELIDLTRGPHGVAARRSARTPGRNQSAFRASRPVIPTAIRVRRAIVKRRPGCDKGTSAVHHFPMRQSLTLAGRCATPRFVW